MNHEPLTSATRQVRQQWFSVGIFPPGLLFGLTGNRPQSAPACSFLRYQQGEKKDSDTENDRENGLRMEKEMTMKEKRFSFFADPQEEKSYANAQLAHCLLPDTQTNPSQKSKSQIFPTHRN